MQASATQTGGHAARREQGGRLGRWLLRLVGRRSPPRHPHATDDSAYHATQLADLAVITQAALARLTAEQPGLAAALLLWLGKRLSTRLRQVSSRASVLLTRLPKTDRG